MTNKDIPSTPIIEATPLTQAEEANLAKLTARDLSSHNESRHPANNILIALAERVLPPGLASRILKRIDDPDAQT